MAQKVKEGEIPARIITIDNKTYLCYPAFAVSDLDTDNGWAIMRIDETDPDDVIITWANGTNEKVHNAYDVLYGDPLDLTWTNII